MTTAIEPRGRQHYVDMQAVLAEARFREIRKAVLGAMPLLDCSELREQHVSASCIADSLEDLIEELGS